MQNRESSEKTNEELVVIGGGPGGYPAAFLAADLGKKVTLIDPEENPGGVCLYRGCIPTKTLLHSTRIIHESRAAAAHGLRYEEPEIDLNALRQWKNDVILRLTEGVGKLSDQRKINRIKGRAVFENSHSIRISTDEGVQSLEFDQAVVATGSLPSSLPHISKSEKIWNSADALELPFIPERLLVVGGGYIGLEMGCIYAALGSRVTLIELLPGILPGADQDLVRVLLQPLKQQYHRISVSSKLLSLEEKNEIVSAVWEAKGQVVKEDFDCALITVGRKPNAAGLGLETTRIQVKDGFIQVDPFLKTAESHIYAVGDVVGGLLLAHKATREGRIAAENLNGAGKEFRPKAIPAVLYTDPEVAWCGLTEAEARQSPQEYDVRVARFPWGACGRAVSMGRLDGVTKYIVDGRTEEILGVGIVGPNAGELIAQGALALEMGAKISDIADTIHAHPTLSETLMEAAESYYGLSTHYIVRKR